MKTYILACAFLVTTCMYAGPSQDKQAAGSDVKVNVESEARSLADGFASASSSLTRPPITLAFQKEGVVRMLEDVKSIRAAEGVLVVEVGKGLTYLINPKDVIYITDGSQVKPKP